MRCGSGPWQRLVAPGLHESRNALLPEVGIKRAADLMVDRGNLQQGDHAIEFGVSCGFSLHGLPLYRKENPASP